jgi:type II restriction/modification system DNA methylase subunit YeeA
MFESVFSFAQSNIKPERLKNKSEDTGTRAWLEENWHHHWRPRGELKQAIATFQKVIITPFQSKYRIFIKADRRITYSNTVVVIARDDDTTLGILDSKFHLVWTLAKNMDMGVGGDPRYPATMTFETFPFPGGLTPNIPAADYADDPRAIKIAAAAARLNELRENWLNPADLVVREPEVVAGYPDRILPKDEDAAKILKTRTLTNLYNTRPAWLDNVHKILDEAVAEAYGWGDDYRAGLLSDDEILSRLFALNQERAGQQK